MTALTLSLTESTIGNSFKLPEIMDFDIHDENGFTLSSASLVISKGSFNFHLHDADTVTLLPGCKSVVHLVAMLTSALTKHLTPDHVNIDQVFDCEETGGVRKLPLES